MIATLQPYEYESDEKFFKYNYRQLYHAMSRTLEHLFDKERATNLRPFHAFRNYYAYQHINQATNKRETARVCGQVLGHVKLSTTFRYAKRQEMVRRARNQTNENLKADTIHFVKNTVPNTIKTMNVLKLPVEA
ncbi:virion protein [Glossina pallidipes salivary gland hypertrophy virus]|uniref:Uncharacterized protein n=2 Tax=Glossina hytrovirus (isolate Glossina pallidipes/Ethiopia/Seibersdorf/-) TaxID=379529 RepID=B0YLI4_GHVS|nr:hypothetical protein SGHV030 [Glossina pallidipes salivary gland hypertrophy virus]ABQ08803.1 hypothetical protein SGHV030 [Glossina pallidipes salivary gland hypertrophy virus]AMB48635.1 virion protein [Glossina pallidipes salivary gland hypertrophy virus]